MNGNTSNIFKLNVRAINPYWSPCHVARNLSSNCGPDFPTWPFFQNPMAQQRSTPNTVTGLHLVKEIEALNTWHWWRHRRCQRAILRYHVDPEGWNCKSIVKVMTPAMSKNLGDKGDSRPMERNVNSNYRDLGKSKVDNINLSTSSTLMPLGRSRTLAI